MFVLYGCQPWGGLLITEDFSELPDVRAMAVATAQNGETVNNDLEETMKTHSRIREPSGSKIQALANQVIQIMHTLYGIHRFQCPSSNSTLVDDRLGL